MSNAPPQRDPKYRPFRALMWALYLLLAVGFSVLVTGSVIRSVWAMEPTVLPAGPSLSVEACADVARGLLGELEARRVALASANNPASAELDWVPFRNEWISRFHQAEGQCLDSSRERAALKETFSQLEDAASRYTVHATQFAQQLGPYLERLRARLDGGVKP